MAAQLDGLPGVAAIELNISCPNVSHGVDFGTDPAMCEQVVAGVPRGVRLPIIAKLTPNVTEHCGDRPRGGAGRRRRDLADQHLAGHGDRLASPPAAAGQRHGRPERPGDQADRPAVRVSGRPRP